MKQLYSNKDVLKKDRRDEVCISLSVNECHNPKHFVFGSKISGKRIYNNRALIKPMFSNFQFVPT